MFNIVSGTFLTFDQAQKVSKTLQTLGISPDLIAEFYRSPDGHRAPRGELSIEDGPHEATAVMGAEAGEQQEEAPPRRRGGPVVAVMVTSPDQADEARDVLAAADALQVEIATGLISNGDWLDYDPQDIPNLILDRGFEA